MVYIFDYEFELNLAVKKLMDGSFNMVTIYIEGLEPRIKDAFKKLWIELPVRKIELVDTKLIEKSIADAKKEREAHIKKEAEEKKEYKSDSANSKEENEVVVNKNEPHKSVLHKLLKKSSWVKESNNNLLGTGLVLKDKDNVDNINFLDKKVNIINKIHDKILNLLDDINMRTGESLKIERIKLNVLSKEINMIHKKEDFKRIVNKFKSFENELKEEYK